MSNTSPSEPSVPAWKQDRPPRIWATTLMFVITFAVAMVLVPWFGLTHGYSVGAWVLFVVLVYANGMSITGGYHRLWAHKSYDAHWSLKLVYLVFGTMALQNSVFVWASGHRTHHLNVDDVDKDPYSIKRGFWFAHMGWMLREYEAGKPDFVNIPDLRRDPMLAFQHRYYLQLALLTNFGIPLLAGWLIGDVWGTFILAGVLRLVVSHHVTFFINSLAHMWGARPYTNENTARDNGLIAFFTYGEGYHNYHHIFAHDYRNGVRWWQWDPTKWMIAGLQYVGLTKRLKRTPAFQIQRALLTMQFQRAQEKLARLPQAVATRSHIEQLREHIAHEYETFLTALSEWARVKEQWLEEKKRAVMDHWEHANFQEKLQEIEARLRTQRRRVRLISAQLVA
jgi:stearoyl-CoA desaturase (Delta-9 desaturase)